MAGLTPEDVRRMTVPEFAAFMHGFAAFHGADQAAEAPSADVWRDALKRDALRRESAA